MSSTTARANKGNLVTDYFQIISYQVTAVCLCMDCRSMANSRNCYQVVFFKFAFVLLGTEASGILAATKREVSGRGHSDLSDIFWGRTQVNSQVTTTPINNQRITALCIYVCQ